MVEIELEIRKLAALLVILAGLGGCGSSPNEIQGFTTGSANQPPEIVLASEVEVFDASMPEPFAPELTVSDDQVTLDGGALTLSLNSEGPVTDALIDVPDSITIGNVQGDNTSRVTVQLGSRATPAAIQEFLRNVSLSRAPGGLSGSGSVELTLFDGRQGEEVLLIPFESTISVGPGLDEATIADALQTINSSRSSGAFVDVADGHNEPDGLSIRSGRHHDGLTLRGADVGRNAGTHSSIRSRTGSGLGSVEIDAENVTADGFNLRTSSSRGFDLSGRSRGVVIKNCFIFSNASRTPGHYGIYAPSPLKPKISDCAFRSWDIGLYLEGVVDEPVTGGSVASNAFVSNRTGLKLAEPMGEFDIIIRQNGFSKSEQDHVRIEGTTQTRMFVSRSEFLFEGTVVVNGPITVEAADSWWGANLQPTSPDQYQELNGGSLNFTPISSGKLFPDFLGL